MYPNIKLKFLSNNAYLFLSNNAYLCLSIVGLLMLPLVLLLQSLKDDRVPTRDFHRKYWGYLCIQ